MSRKVMVSLKEPKARLENLKEHLVDASEGLVMFSQYLAKFLTRSRITPAGFLKAWDKAYTNMRRGREGRKKLRHPLVGQSGLVYFLILSSFRNVAIAIFPSQFVDQLDELRAAKK